MPTHVCPAAAMLHWFRADRPGQARGVPDILPALPLFAQLRRFTLAVIAAAETAADFAGILYTDAPAGGGADAAEPFEPIELEQRALVTMPGGWKMSQLEAQQPATTYAEFKHEILNEIARCLNMPFNVAAGNSSGYNYASGRLDHQTYFMAIRVEQAHLEAVVLDRLLAAWFDEAPSFPAFCLVCGHRRLTPAARNDPPGQPHDHAGSRIRPAGPGLGRSPAPAGQGSRAQARTWPDAGARGPTQFQRGTRR
ncbi:MAG: phage portal protein [Gemmataceae bacterium]|nr:phage portal protein [Gemmataceae bacterium]